MHAAILQETEATSIFVTRDQSEAMSVVDRIVKIVAPAHPRVLPGEQLHLSFKNERIHLFDSDTTGRLN